MKKIFKHHKTLKNRIFISIIISTYSILAIATICMFQETVRTIKNQALYSFETNTQKTASLLDSKLEVVKEMSEKLNLDSRLYSIFENLDINSELSLMKANETITAILRDYLPWYSNIYSVHLVTPYYRFGEEDKNYYPNFEESKIFEKSKQANGSLIWFPTYSYTKMYKIQNLNDDQIPYGKLFSAARLMNLSDVSSGKVKRLNPIDKNPILVINFTQDYIKNILYQYATNDSMNATEYYIISEENELVYNTDNNNHEKNINWINTASLENSFGGYELNGNDSKSIIGYAKSKICGWYVIMKIPIDSLIGNFKREYFSSFIIMLVLLAIVAFFLSWFVSTKINQSFYKVIGVISNIGEGNFNQTITYNNEDEFSFFYTKINQMNKDLQNLIHENYEVKLVQKETQIRALNTQLNPHFIYNTLNVINWSCLEGRTLDASKMIVNLSRMLQYTTYHNDPEELLSDDLEWLKKYIDILRIRFADKFDVKITIPDELLDIHVPKLFLQPFVENSVIHGFNDSQEKGLLEISAEYNADEVFFYVEDNGKGMTTEEIETVLHKKKSSIGMMNVNEIISILYGNDFGVQISSQIGEGTSVQIHIPLKKI